MRVWKLVIRPDPDEADLAQGYALAETCEEALSLASHPHALAFPKHPDTPWEAPSEVRVFWTAFANKALSRQHVGSN